MRGELVPSTGWGTGRRVSHFLLSMGRHLPISLSVLDLVGMWTVTF